MNLGNPKGRWHFEIPYGYEDTPFVSECDQKAIDKESEEYQIQCEKDGMYDAYLSEPPGLPNNCHYMKGYNSVKK